MARTRPAWTLDALRHLVLGRLPFLPRARDNIRSVADRSWTIAPEEATEAPAAFYLPGQLERITGQEFNADPPIEQVRARIKTHGPTRGYQLRNVTLLDGTLYKGDARSFLAPRRTRWLPQFTTDAEIATASLFCSAVGLRYFGNWLIDDCATYSLAAEIGHPTTLDTPQTPHTVAYGKIFGMQPQRLNNVFIKELTVFDDHSQNSHKRVRFRRLVSLAAATVEAEACPGVFILRGGHGARRVLTNELELAEWLKRKRGFRIIEPISNDVSAVLAACKGARVVVGIEGSALIHGLMTLGEGGSVVTLQPPNRFVSVYKNLTDRDHQHFGFVVGEPVSAGGDFFVRADELERTLDLLPGGSSN